jgi:manganese-dependent inorganic pyrophosphatase
MIESPIYVIGHVNPDTDSIAAAMGYAWLLRERDGSNAIAGRAGAVNSQTSWVLKALGIDAPLLIRMLHPGFPLWSDGWTPALPMFL